MPPGVLIQEHELLVIKPSPIHGVGGFARWDIPDGTRVIEYLGEAIDRQESVRRCQQGNPFIFRLDDTRDLDGNVEGNPARHLNHSCAPNCVAEVAEGRVWIVACRPIPAGEEITFNYGYDLENYQDYPCHCGAPECVGYMVAGDFFPLLRRRRAWQQTLPGSDFSLELCPGEA
jgi:SET domain-containing protein